MKNHAKQLISTLLSVVIIVCSCVAVSSAAEFKYGDIDGNGVINSSDALAVLRNSVGSLSFSADEKKRADVDGNGVVNSSDALDVLRYSVGSLKTFKVEMPVAPTNNNEKLALYINAVKKARDELPSYRLSSLEETKDVHVELTNMFGKPTMEDEARKAEAELESSTPYRGYCAKNSSQSLNNLPVECRLTDASKLESITVKVTDNGTFKIDIKFKDESKPNSNSPVCRALGMPDYNTMKDVLTDKMTVEGAQFDVQLEEFSYKGCWISCEIDPSTGEFITLDWCINTYITTYMPLGIVNNTTSMTQTTTTNYWDFLY